MEYRTDEAHEKTEKILRELFLAAIWFIAGMVAAVLISCLLIETKHASAPLSNYLGYYFLAGSALSGVFLFIRYMDERRYKNIKAGKMMLYGDKVSAQHLLAPHRRAAILGPGYLVLFLSPLVFVWLLSRRLYQLFRLRQEKVPAE